MWGDTSLWFWFAFPWWIAVLNTLPLWKNVCSVLSPIFQLGCLFFDVDCMNCFYMLDTNPLWVILFVNIFSHSVVCFFILSMVSFAVQKFLSLIRSHLFAFAFMFFASGDISKKYCYESCQRMIFLYFLQQVLWFLVLHLDLYSSLSLFLYIVWKNVLISFFYM